VTWSAAYYESQRERFWLQQIMSLTIFTLLISISYAVLVRNHALSQYCDTSRTHGGRSDALDHAFYTKTADNASGASCLRLVEKKKRLQTNNLPQATTKLLTESQLQPHIERKDVDALLLRPFCRCNKCSEVSRCLMSCQRRMHRMQVFTINSEANVKYHAAYHAATFQVAHNSTPV
jgi:hypothetical protein